ncbi:hypothetical protein BD289DRAFT_431270 [Coniella lustricola]|uniref:Uncharacterized protein n=1 Tax=Coniella lustricola TaxID=2025994 RepID=A0A2T3AAZ0_9PEZI|nr:hypothetical protein BD289DRAFT_431270 [Coniella lustricola]
MCIFVYMYVCMHACMHAHSTRAASLYSFDRALVRKLSTSIRDCLCCTAAYSQYKLSCAAGTFRLFA